MEPIKFEPVPTTPNIHGEMRRAKVPGGWLVVIEYDATSLQQAGSDLTPRQGYEFRSTMCFYPDPTHAWLNTALENTIKSMHENMEQYRKQSNPPPFREGHDSFGEGGIYTPGDPGL